MRWPRLAQPDVCSIAVLFAEARQVRHRMGDKLFAARILALRRIGEELYEVLRLGRGLRPALRRGCEEQLLEFLLAEPQGSLIGLELMEALAADLGRLLGRHAPVLVEIDRIVRHRLCALCLDPGGADRSAAALARRTDGRGIGRHRQMVAHHPSFNTVLIAQRRAKGRQASAAGPAKKASAARSCQASGLPWPWKPTCPPEAVISSLREAWAAQSKPS